MENETFCAILSDVMDTIASSISMDSECKAPTIKRMMPNFRLTIPLAFPVLRLAGFKGTSTKILALGKTKMHSVLFRNMQDGARIYFLNYSPSEIIERYKLGWRPDQEDYLTFSSIRAIPELALVHLYLKE